jgi:glycosyltransferase involved in cell wall biosynthesis
MAKLPTVSVVIPTYERRDAALRAVEPLLAEPDALEVIVVVDGSRDGTLEALGETAERDPRLRPVWVENGGEMAARAKGAELARGDVILFLDDDVLAEPGLVRAHARRHGGAERTVVVGHMPVAPPPPNEPYSATALLYAREYAGRCASYERDPSLVLRHLWAGNFSLRREDCAALGLAQTSFRERYHPDRELGLRCLQLGLSGVFAREARASHHYRRPLPAFVRDARSQGAARVILHRMHPELLGPLPAQPFTRDLRGPLRGLVALGARWPRLDRLWLRALEGLARALRRLPRREPELAALRLLRRVAQVQGARDAVQAT